MNIRCVDYRPAHGRTIKGLVSLKFIDVGLELRDVAFHEDSERQWLVMPRNKFFQNGEAKFFYYALFPDKRDFQHFSEIALTEIKRFRDQREGRG